ncbi:MAG: YceD family protein [Pseudobdellovibrio sp.]
MRIKLHEIPEEGRQYILNRKTAELNSTLQDIIADHAYDVQVFIKPLNTKNFSLTGQIETATIEICSACGDSFKFKVKTQVNEILIPSEYEPKNSQFSKSNHVSELDGDGPGVSEYKNDVFELGEFVHEAIALVIPYNPKPDVDEKGACKICFKTISTEFFSYDEKMGEVVKTNPFSALKGIKLN